MKQNNHNHKPVTTPKSPWPPTRALTAFDLHAQEYEGWLKRNCRKIIKIVIWAMRSRTE